MRKISWRHADFAVKARAEGRLAVEADEEPDFDEGPPRIPDELLCSLDPPSDDELMKPNAHGALEGSAEMEWAETGLGREAGEGERTIEIGVYMVDHAAEMEWRKHRGGRQLDVPPNDAARDPRAKFVDSRCCLAHRIYLVRINAQRLVGTRYRDTQPSGGVRHANFISQSKNSKDRLP